MDMYEERGKTKQNEEEAATKNRRKQKRYTRTLNTGRRNNKFKEVEVINNRKNTKQTK